MPYRDCAGIVVFNKNGEVFLGKRHNSGVGALDHVWQFPQGGIDGGEEPVDAALRELFEETSIRSISMLTAAPDWIHYDLPDDLLGVALKGKYRGQRQKWFAVLFEGDESEINVTAPADGAHPSEFSTWRWSPLEAVPGLIVPFKREAYQKIAAAFAHIPGQVRGL
jgi:putative (di)nucleoside polyphosphate hydrolase